MRCYTNWILLFVLCCVTSCKKDNADPLFSTDLTHATETNLQSFFSDNPSQEDVIKVFGKPLFQSTNSDGNEFVIYEWDNPVGHISTGWSNKLSGFEIYYSNNTVSYWAPTYSSFQVVKSNLVIPIPKTTASELGIHHKLSFYVVASSQLPNGKYINTEKFEHLGYVSSTPDFSILRLKSVKYHLIQSSVNNSIVNQYMVIMSLETNDAELFKEFTARNTGSRILITLDESLVQAPLLVYPISDGELGIRGLSESESSNLVNHLEDITDK
jgi:hypothetical protein